MIRALLCGAFVALVIPAAAQDWDCTEPGNLPQQGMNFCAAVEFEEADRALNVAWRVVSERIEASDAEMPEQWQGWPQTLLEAQRAWLGYRDGHCASEGFKYRGGSIEPLIVATCRTALTRERTQELLLLIEEG